MKILITGAAGFIGAAVTQKLLRHGCTVVGVDNHNDYYDPSLKEARLELSLSHPKYQHIRLNIADREGVSAVFNLHNPDKVLNLAAQAGVRYSIENPASYIDSNIVGFANILEGCRATGVKHLVYASTSSVYGSNTELPFATDQNVDHPLSLYAATKKSNELMAHAYSHLYGLPTTGLRLFTVYGPWGRPDMALFKFTKAIIEGKPIQVFNLGKHRRDFTFIDDIVEGIVKVLDRPPAVDVAWDGAQPHPATSGAPYRVYNLGNGQSIELMHYILALERALGKSAIKEFLPIQPGDVLNTHADITESTTQFGYAPQTNVDTGIERFVNWYQRYYC